MLNRLLRRTRLCALLTAIAVALASTANAADRIDVHFPSLDAHRTMIAGALFRPDRPGRLGRAVDGPLVTVVG